MPKATARSAEGAGRLRRPGGIFFGQGGLTALTRDRRTNGRGRGAASLAVCAALLALAAPARGGEYDKIAAQLAARARTHGRSRLAVLPFQEVGGKGSTSGRIVSERLLAPLAASNGVEVVERAMLDSVMREQRLQTSGAVDSRTLTELGRVLGVSALVTGTVIALKDDRVEVNARLIDAETAKVLLVVEARVERDWNESMFDDASWQSLASLPSLDLAADASAAAWDCASSDQQVDALERQVVDLKARFWSQKLREGLPAAALTRNPGSEIRNPEIRAEFYARLRAYTRQAGPALTEDEIERLKDALRRISRIGGSCRGEDS